MTFWSGLSESGHSLTEMSPVSRVRKAAESGEAMGYSSSAESFTERSIPGQERKRLKPFTETRGQRSNRAAENSRDKAQERIVSFILSQKECWPTPPTMKCKRRKWSLWKGLGANRPQCEEGLAVAL